MNTKTVLAIDPGSSKCGMAVVGRTEEGKLDLRWRCIAKTVSIVEQIQIAADNHSFELVILGGGTNSHNVLSRIREELPGLPVLVVDEQETTMQARERYWTHNSRRGWRRFLPSTLQVPPEPVDDYVALILAERVLLHS
jgi:RNase H-fold protein (predicted Holliday junction resolvase)